MSCKESDILWILLFACLSLTKPVCGTISKTFPVPGKAKCLEILCAKIQTNKIGILILQDIDYSTNDILMSVFDKGISSNIFEISEETSDSILNITEKWKLLGIKHILFMQYDNSKLLDLWSKILGTICDNIWWLFFDENDVQNQLLEIWNESSCTAMGWILLNKSCFLQSYSTYDVANMDNTSNQEMFLNSSITRRQSHSLKTSINHQRRRKETSKPKLVRLAIDESPPYLTLNTSTNGQIELLGGPEAELLRTLQQKFGFEYKLMKSPDGEWGRIKDGSWTGLIGMVTRKEADMASGCVSITSQRYGACGFSYPYDIQKSVIISKTPEEKPKTYAVLLPFPIQVWLLMLFSLLVYLLLFYFTGRVYQTIYLTQSYRLESLFWYLYGTICAEGGKLTSIIQGPSAVLLLIVWLLFVLVMQASYCGTLMSVLTFPWSEPSINTLHDLAQAVVKKGYKCGCRKGTINCDTMLELQGDLKVIAESLYSDKRNFVRSVREGLERVLEGNFAFLAQHIGSVYEAQTMPSPYFSMSGEGLDIELFSLAVREDFQFLEGINEVILRLSEAGLIAKWRNDLTSKNNMQFSTRKYEIPKINPLSLTELTGALLMFSYGLCLALTTFFIEKGIFRWKRAASCNVLSKHASENY